MVPVVVAAALNVLILARNVMVRATAMLPPAQILAILLAKILQMVHTRVILYVRVVLPIVVRVPMGPTQPAVLPQVFVAQAIIPVV